MCFFWFIVIGATHLRRALSHIVQSTSVGGAFLLSPTHWVHEVRVCSACLGLGIHSSLIFLLVDVVDAVDTTRQREPGVRQPGNVCTNTR